MWAKFGGGRQVERAPFYRHSPARLPLICSPLCRFLPFAAPYLRTAPKTEWIETEGLIRSFAYNNNKLENSFRFPMHIGEKLPDNMKISKCTPIHVMNSVVCTRSIQDIVWHLAIRYCIPPRAIRIIHNTHSQHKYSMFGIYSYKYPLFILQLLCCCCPCVCACVCVCGAQTDSQHAVFFTHLFNQKKKNKAKNKKI